LSRKKGLFAFGLLHAFPGVEVKEARPDQHTAVLDDHDEIRRAPVAQPEALESALGTGRGGGVGHLQVEEPAIAEIAKGLAADGIQTLAEHFGTLLRRLG
jgi:hypothetical protein